MVGHPRSSPDRELKDDIGSPRPPQAKRAEWPEGQLGRPMISPRKEAGERTIRDSSHIQALHVIHYSEVKHTTSPSELCNFLSFKSLYEHELYDVDGFSQLFL